MKNALGFIVLAFGLAACAVEADTTEDTALSSVSAEVSVAEPDGVAALDDTASTLACIRIWECRDCGAFKTQNVLVDACTGQVVRARSCGEPCF
jgi:hypothetical protein